MRWETVQGIVERLVLVGFTYLVSKGYLTPDQATHFVTAVVALIAAIWGWYVNRPKALLQATANLSEVTKVELKHSEVKLADSVPSPKVEVR